MANSRIQAARRVFGFSAIRSASAFCLASITYGPFLVGCRGAGISRSRIFYVLHKAKGWPGCDQAFAASKLGRSLPFLTSFKMRVELGMVLGRAQPAPVWVGAGHGLG